MTECFSAGLLNQWIKNKKATIIQVALKLKNHFSILISISLKLYFHYFLFSCSKYL